MSSFRRHHFSIRGESLQKLTQLSMNQTSNTSGENTHAVSLKSTTDQLSVSYSTDKSKIYTIPLTMNEIEILFAICDSAPVTESQACDLIDNVISHYFMTCTKQKFNEISKNKFKNLLHNKRNDGRSVYECLTFNVCLFLIKVYEKFPALQPKTELLFKQYFNSFQFSIYSLCSLLGLINSFITYGAKGKITKLHDIVLLQLWELSFNNGNTYFQEKITYVFNKENFDDTLMSYFDSNYELSSFVFGERIGALQTMILMSKFNFSDEYSFIEHVLRLKKNELLSEEGSLKYHEFMENLTTNRDFFTTCLDYSLKTLDYLQHESLDLSTFNRVEFAFMNKDSCLQISSLLPFISDSVDQDPKVSKILKIIVEFMHEYTDESYLFYEGFLVSIMAFASLLNYYTEVLTTDLLAMFPIFIANKFVSNNLVIRISKNFSLGLQPLTEDAVVSSVYDVTNLLGDSSSARISNLKQRKTTFNESIDTQIQSLLPQNSRVDDSVEYSIKQFLKDEDTQLSPPAKNGRIQKRSNTLTTLQSMNIFKNLPAIDAVDEASIKGTHESESLTADYDSITSEFFNRTSARQVAAEDEKDELWRFWNNVVSALVNVASVYNDQSVNVLTITILTQKFGNISEKLDDIIMKKIPVLVNKVGETEFEMLIKFIQFHEKTGKAKSLVISCIESRCEISKILHNFGISHPLYKIYLKELLEHIVGEGENQLQNVSDDIFDFEEKHVSKSKFTVKSSSSSTHSRSQSKSHKTVDEVLSNNTRIKLYLKPLALLLPNTNEPKINYEKDLDETLINLIRNSWFNMTVHGFTFPLQDASRSKPVKVTSTDEQLQIFAYNSPPLASNFPKSTKETSFEMNNILRRGTSESNLKLQNSVIQHFYKFEKPLISTGLSNQVKVLFLSSSIMLELYRCESESDDSISSCILYLSSSQVKSSFRKFFEKFSLELIKVMYVKHPKLFNYFNLKKLLVCTSSRDSAVQKQAFECCDLFIQTCPELLLRDETSVFMMLDLLSVLFKSCIDMKRNGMSPIFEYRVNDDTETVYLPLNEVWRMDTLQLMEKFYSKWITTVLKSYQNDVEILLQKYISLRTRNVSGTDLYSEEIDYSITFALNHATMLSSVEKPVLKGIFPRFSAHSSLKLDNSYKFLSKQSWNSSFWTDNVGFLSRDEINKTRNKMNLSFDGKEGSENILQYLNLTSNLLLLPETSKHGNVVGRSDDLQLLRELFEVFMVALGNRSCVHKDQLESLSIIKHSINIWANLLKERVELQGLIMSEFVHCYTLAMDDTNGNLGFEIFSRELDIIGSEYNIMEYSPSNNETIHNQDNIKLIKFEKFYQVFQFWTQFIKKEYKPRLHNKNKSTSSSLSESFNPYYGLNDIIESYIDKVCNPGFFQKLSNHPYGLKIRLEICQLLLIFIEENNDVVKLNKICHWLIYDGSFWFSSRNGVSNTSVYGSNEIEWSFVLNKLKSLLSSLNKNSKKIIKFLTHGGRTDSDGRNHFIVLELLISSEIQSLNNWIQSEVELEIGSISSNNITEELLKSSFRLDFGVGLSLVKRFNLESNEKFNTLINNVILSSALNDSILANGDFILLRLIESVDLSNIGSSVNSKILHYIESNIIFFHRISPIKSINIFKSLSKIDSSTTSSSSSFINNIIQFNMKSLEQHDSNLVFFYIPQIVQCLRYDDFGYVEKFIIDTGKINMYFQHQIIWNMKANMFKDDEGLIPDEILKPLLDKLLDKILNSFSKRERVFYNLEFGFFNEITSISGKLKPYIKKTKIEKKLKIDQEMALIEIKPKVYLPSNPDGIVIDIDRLSGKPLQSHAKAPFMATFKILKSSGPESGNHPIIKWQSAIFKVGDDCRQDVLALQLINVCKNIWEQEGLDIYVFPYRVIATNAGCGVIDVLPHSISRDMLGREAVNGLYEWFINKFGEENSREFELARLNFIKSLAGYSVISYLLQFKDRHNGNIMYDDMGHILHIDFGFIFDIVPGGVKFEAVPFKLTKEMIKILGGSKESKYYQLFTKLCCQSFLKLRKNHEFILNVIEPMLDSGLPCFKLKTMRNLEQRFVLNKSDHQATQYMRNLINKSYESLFTKGYDEFQKLTNGIPY